MVFSHVSILKQKTILARIVDVRSIIQGEYAENEVRRDFTPSERVAIAKAIEREVGNRRGQRTDRLVGKTPQVAPGKKPREVAAAKAGFELGRRYHGIDISATYGKIAERRIAAYRMKR